MKLQKEHSNNLDHLGLHNSRLETVSHYSYLWIEVSMHPM